MTITVLLILLNCIVAAFCFYVGHAPKFRPISWGWYRVLASMSILNAAVALISTIRIILV